jgi:transcriptional regulator with XRE-family HTH domain
MNQSAEYAIARRYFARSLKQLMHQHNLTPAALMRRTADLAGQKQVPCGVFDSSIHRYLKGETLPTKDRAEALAIALGVEAEDMLPVGFEIPEGRLARRKKEPEASVEVKRVGGLEFAQLNVRIRANLPAKKAITLAQYIKELLRKADIEVADESAS